MATMPSRTTPVNQVNAAPLSSHWTVLSIICDSTFPLVFAPAFAASPLLPPITHDHPVQPTAPPFDPRHAAPQPFSNGVSGERPAE